MHTQDASVEDDFAQAREFFYDSDEDSDSPDNTGRQMTRKEQLSSLERTLSRNSPILTSLLLHLPTTSILQLYHTSPFLRNLLRSCPIAWKHLSFRLAVTSTPITNPNTPDEGLGTPRPSKNYALDQLLLRVVNPFSSNLKSLDLDNTAVSGQILTSTVLLLRRETLEHLSVRGCKNVSLKYHLNPYLNVFGLQHDAANEDMVSGRAMSKMALKSLYTYRCRHHRRRPYLPASLSRKDSDSEPTHELVTLCRKLGIWTDTAWCTTPGNRCYRRRNYVQMRVPNGTSEVWVVFDRLWRSRNWMGPAEGHRASELIDGRLWEQEEYASHGEALGINCGKTYHEGKATPAHLRASHRKFVENISCDNCGDEILERCEQCSILMHCAGCRKTLCASCAFDRPYSFRKRKYDTASDANLWWAPGYIISPSTMAELPPAALQANNVAQMPMPNLNFKWCCMQPIFSGGGGMTFAQGAIHEAERVRATPLPRGQGWEDPEFLPASSSAASSNALRTPPPTIPERLSDEDRAYIVNWLLGPPGKSTVECPRNLCAECYDSETWKVHCKTCSKPLCMEHDLRGLRLRICGLKDLHLEKNAIREKAAKAALARATQADPPRSPGDGPVTSALQLTPSLLSPQVPVSSTPDENAPSSHEPTTDHIENAPIVPAEPTESTLQVPLHHPLPSRPLIPILSGSASSLHARPSSVGSIQTVTSRTSSPSSVYHEPSQPGCSVQYPAPPSWTGCLSFFCPVYRPPGDLRARCASASSLKECTSCSTWVCGDCITSSTFPVSASGCKCSSCHNAFYCPNCQHARVESGECRKAEEERLEKERQERKARLELEEKKSREKSEWVMGLVGEFFGRMEEAGRSSEIQPAEYEGDIAGVLRRFVPRLRTEDVSENEPLDEVLQTQPASSPES